MTIEASQLAKLYPLDSLRPENLEQLAKEAHAEELGKGTVLFTAGDTDDQMIYLLEGVVKGTYADGKVKMSDAASLQGRYPVGDLQPRRFTATVESRKATIAKLDRRFTEKVLTWDQLSRSENFRHYDAEPDANRWVWRQLHNRALDKMPTGNF